MKTPIEGARDPVVLTIETLLREIEANGKGTIRNTSEEESIVLYFDDIRAEGKTLDIALVRLASAMIDDVNYMPLLKEALNGPMHSAATQFMS